MTSVLHTDERSGTKRAKHAAASSESDRTHRYRWWILTAIGLAQLMVVLDATIVNIALPSAQKDLGFSDGDRQWAVTAYALAFGSLLLLGGRIADLFGRKRTLMIGLVGFAGTSALAGAAGTFEVLIAARAGQGAFGALLAPAALSLLSTTFTDAKERTTAFSVYSAIAGAGGAIGLLLGGVLTEYLDWRWTLYVNVFFAAAALVGAVLFLPRNVRDKSAKLDVPGALLVFSGLFALVYGFANAESDGWGAGATYGPLIAGVVLLVAFGVWQTKASYPLLPLRIMADRNRFASFVSILVIGAGMFGVFLFLTYFMQQSLGYTPVKTGLAFLPMIAALGAGTTLASKILIPRFGPKPIVPVGMILAGAAMLWMTRLDLSSGYVSELLPQLVLAGVGMGLIMSPAMEIATQGVEPEHSGAASAMVNTMQQVGGSIGTALLTTFSADAAKNYLVGKNPANPLVAAQSALESYHSAFAWSAVFFAVGAVISLLVYRRGVPEHDENAAPVVHM